MARRRGPAKGRRNLIKPVAVCGLRAGLSSCRDADAWILHDPRLWLGIAFHTLMEKARSGLAATDLSAAWNEEIERFELDLGVKVIDCVRLIQHLSRLQVELEHIRARLDALRSASSRRSD